MAAENPDLVVMMSPSVVDSNVRLEASTRNMIRLEEGSVGQSLLRTGHFDDDRNGPMMTQSCVETDISI